MQDLYAAAKGTTPFHIYKMLVATRAGISMKMLDGFRARLHTAYDMGEPAWMIADEIKLRASAPKPTKTPRALALRVVTVQ
jgi:hypothetical protein